MQFRLEKRREPSQLMVYLTPVAAVVDGIQRFSLTAAQLGP